MSNKIRFTPNAIGQLVLLAALLLFVGAPVFAAETIDVSLKSGRTFSGLVDKKTDESHLVLRFGNASTYLLRRVSWQQVSSATVGEETISAKQLRSRVDRLATDFVAPEKDTTKPAVTGQRTYADRARAALRENRITHISIQASLANWDADVAADGIIVHVFPMDSKGRVVPVQGGLNVELFATAQVDFNEVPRSRGLQSQKIGRWYHRIGDSNYNESGITVKLPFGRINPETATQISNHGLVHVTFNVPGHGTFQSSQDYVRIRGFAPTRDQLEVKTGQRYFPSEGVRD
ncbi:MAG: hypothetical protein ACI9G1_004406 [Pirellulaceae bacterium]|jgi:hypothetical protein